MKMTFDQYIMNPMGMKNAVFSARNMYRELYTEKLKLIMLRETGKVQYYTYINKDKYYLYIKIPSEVIENFYYDVVIEFYTDSDVCKRSKTLKDYYIKFFSNDPSFVFTFAHAMIHNDLFVRDLVPRMSKEAVKKVAKERNPKNEVGYVKSLYFTYLIMKDKNLFEKILFENNIDKYNQKKLLSMITHSDIKIKDRQDKAKDKSEKKKKDKDIKRAKTMQASPDTTYIKSGNTKFVKNTKTIGKTRNSKNIKTVKRI
ncbi:MAG: hypothetical protein ACRCXT_21130 [Paraclostridium sp.]